MGQAACVQLPEHSSAHPVLHPNVLSAQHLLGIITTAPVWDYHCSTPEGFVAMDSAGMSHHILTCP